MWSIFLLSGISSGFLLSLKIAMLETSGVFSILQQRGKTCTAQTIVLSLGAPLECSSVIAVATEQTQPVTTLLFSAPSPEVVINGQHHEKRDRNCGL
jgi:hypothetical protein